MERRALDHVIHLPMVKTMPEPFDDYLQALQAAADLYATDNIASRIAAVSATISFLRAADDDRSLITPLMDVLGRLEDEREYLRRMDDADEDGRRRGIGNTKPVMLSVNDAAMSAVITLAIRTGKTSKQAAVMVAEHIGLGAHDPRAVQRLVQSRKNLMDKKASPAALRIYDLMITGAAKARTDGMSPDEALSKALDFLREKITAQSS
jgi:hypothetical protein